jgi:hypothetical protein
MFLLIIENWKQRKLFRKMCCFNDTDKYGTSPLIFAALEYKTKVFLYHTEIGVIIIIIISNAKNDSAFHSAALLASVNIIIFTG